MRRAQRRLLAVCAKLDVPRGGLAEAVDRDLRQASARELEQHEVDGVGLACRRRDQPSAARTRRWAAPPKRWSSRSTRCTPPSKSVRFGMAARHATGSFQGGMSISCEIWQKTSRPTSALPMLDLDRAKDRLLAVLVIDRHAAGRRRRRPRGRVRLVDGVDERLLAEHVRATRQRLQQSVAVRVGRRRDDHDVGSRLLE